MDIIKNLSVKGKHAILYTAVTISFLFVSDSALR